MVKDKCEKCPKEEVINIAMERIDGLEKKINGFNGDAGISSNIAAIKNQLDGISNRNKNFSGWVKATFLVFLTLLGVGTTDHFITKYHQKVIDDLDAKYIQKDYVVQYFTALEDKNILLEHMLLTVKYAEFIKDKTQLDSLNRILDQHNATRGPKKEKEDWLKTDSIH